MKIVAEPLTPAEARCLQELVTRAGGIPSAGEISGLTERQKEMLLTLKDKGYLLLTRLQYRVLRMGDSRGQSAGK